MIRATPTDADGTPNVHQAGITLPGSSNSDSLKISRPATSDRASAAQRQSELSVDGTTAKNAATQSETSQHLETEIDELLLDLTSQDIERLRATLIESAAGAGGTPLKCKWLPDLPNTQ